MQNRSLVFFAATLMLSLTTIDAYANGIPVIFAVSVFHIIFINTLVIAIEAFLLKRLSKSKIRVGYMILANLASLFLAFTLTSPVISSYFHSQWFGLEGKGKIEKKIFVAGVAIFIIFTILIEWIFFYWAQKENKTWLRSLKYTAIINLITNIPIAVFYLVNDLYYDPGD